MYTYYTFFGIIICTQDMPWCIFSLDLFVQNKSLHCWQFFCTHTFQSGTHANYNKSSKPFFDLNKDLILSYSWICTYFIRSEKGVFFHTKIFEMIRNGDFLWVTSEASEESGPMNKMKFFEIKSNPGERGDIVSCHCQLRL